MESENLIKSSINLLIILDVESFIHQSFEKSSDISTTIPVIPDTSFVIQNREAIMLPNQVIISAKSGNILKIRATTIDLNSTYAAIIYRIMNLQSARQGSTFQFTPITIKAAVQPNAYTTDGLPANQICQSFSSFNFPIHSAGKKKLRVFFALYGLNDTSECQNLRGYFCFDISLNIKLNLGDE